MKRRSRYFFLIFILILSLLLLPDCPPSGPHCQCKREAEQEKQKREPFITSFPVNLDMPFLWRKKERERRTSSPSFFTSLGALIPVWHLQHTYLSQGFSFLCSRLFWDRELVVQYLLGLQQTNAYERVLWEDDMCLSIKRKMYPGFKEGIREHERKAQNIYSLQLTLASVSLSLTSVSLSFLNKNPTINKGRCSWWHVLFGGGNRPGHQDKRGRFLSCNVLYWKESIYFLSWKEFEVPSLCLSIFFWILFHHSFRFTFNQPFLFASSKEHVALGFPTAVSQCFLLFFTFEFVLVFLFWRLYSLLMLLFLHAFVCKGTYESLDVWSMKIVFYCFHFFLLFFPSFLLKRRNHSKISSLFYWCMRSKKTNSIRFISFSFLVLSSPNCSTILLDHYNTGWRKRTWGLQVNFRLLFRRTSLDHPQTSSCQCICWFRRSQSSLWVMQSKDSVVHLSRLLVFSWFRFAHLI